MEFKTVNFKIMAKENLVTTNLTSLEIGDKVQIKHAHTYKHGYFLDWSKVNYWYEGVESKKHVFRHINIPKEKFTMTSEDDNGSVLVGKFTNTSKL